LHRQFRPAGAGDLQDDQRERHRGGGGALRQPQFRGRINADVRANYLASPPLVVAYALAGSMYADLVKQPLGLDKKGKKVFLKDIWPTSREITSLIRKTSTSRSSPEIRRRIQRRCALAQDQRQGWPHLRLGQEVTYVQNPPYFVGMGKHPAPLADIVDGEYWRSCSTRSPPTTSRRQARSSSIRPRQVPDRSQGQAGRLQPVRHPARQSRSDDARHFANIRLKNQMVPVSRAASPSTTLRASA